MKTLQAIQLAGFFRLCRRHDDILGGAVSRRAGAIIFSGATWAFCQ
ncbi:hypothetical protein [Rugamonas rubra]|nr:hypothetical protein [Rugamonas rubra]